MNRCPLQNVPWELFNIRTYAHKTCQLQLELATNETGTNMEMTWTCSPEPTYISSICISLHHLSAEPKPGSQMRHALDDMTSHHKPPTINHTFTLLPIKSIIHDLVFKSATIPPNQHTPIPSFANPEPSHIKIQKNSPPKIANSVHVHVHVSPAHSHAS